MTIKEAIKEYLNESGLKLKADEVSVYSLPDKYNGVRYETIVNGKRTNTVGEYKEAIAKRLRSW